MLLILTIFGAVLAYYLSSILNPFDQEKIDELVAREEIRLPEEFESVLSDLQDRGLLVEYLNTKNVGILAAVVGVSIAAGFAFIHMVLDKLLIRRLFEPASVFLALRRGILIALLVVSFAALKLMGAELYLYLLVIGLALITELMIGWAVRSRRKQAEDLAQRPAESAPPTAPENTEAEAPADVIVHS